MYSCTAAAAEFSETELVCKILSNKLKGNSMVVWIALCLKKTSIDTLTFYVEEKSAGQLTNIIFEKHDGSGLAYLLEGPLSMTMEQQEQQQETNSPLFTFPYIIMTPSIPWPMPSGLGHINGYGDDRRPRIGQFC